MVTDNGNLILDWKFVATQVCHARVVHVKWLHTQCGKIISFAKYCSLLPEYFMVIPGHGVNILVSHLRITNRGSISSIRYRGFFNHCTHCSILHRTWTGLLWGPELLKYQVCSASDVYLVI